jgi:hypothetical protein
MSNVLRRGAIRLAAAAGAAALAGAGVTAAGQPLKRPKGNAEPPITGTATAENYGRRELFAVVDEAGNLKRGSHAVSSRQLDTGVYEVIFSRDVRRGVYLATPGGHGYVGIPPTAVASVVGRAMDPRGVLVYIANMEGTRSRPGSTPWLSAPTGRRDRAVGGREACHVGSA